MSWRSRRRTRSTRWRSKYTNDLPPAVRHALAALGMLKGSGGALASYLLFEPAFVRSLIAMGESDAATRKDELLALILDP
jgi:NTE family protein